MQTLSQFNIHLTKNIAEKIGIKLTFFNASELENFSSSKDDLLVSICKEIDCNTYLSAKGSYVYIEANSEGGAFSKNKMTLYYQNYEHPQYEQLYPPFLPYMGIIDGLFNLGFDNILEVIREGRCPSYDSQTIRQLEGVLF